MGGSALPGDVIHDFLASAKLAVAAPAASPAAVARSPARLDRNWGFRRENEQQKIVWDEGRCAWVRSREAGASAMNVPAARLSDTAFLRALAAELSEHANLRCTFERLRDLEQKGIACEGVDTSRAELGASGAGLFLEIRLQLRFQAGWVCMSSAKRTLKARIAEFVPLETEKKGELEGEGQSQKEASEGGKESFKGSLLDPGPAGFLAKLRGAPTLSGASPAQAQRAGAFFADFCAALPMVELRFLTRARLLQRRSSVRHAVIAFRDPATAYFVNELLTALVEKKRLEILVKKSGALSRRRDSAGRGLGAEQEEEYDGDELL